MNASCPPSESPQFRICFESPLFGNRTVSFACDEHGNVDLGGLSEPDRCDYLFARIMMRSGWVHPRILPR